MKIYMLYGRGEAMMTLGHTPAASLEEAARNFHGTVEKYDGAKPEKILEQLGGNLTIKWDDCGKFVPTPETAEQIVDELIRLNPITLTIDEDVEAVRRDMIEMFISEYEPFHIGQGLAVAPKEA